MVGLFAFDGPMYCDKNGVYCNTTITNEMLDRYFIVIDKLVLLIRTFHLKQTYIEAKLKKLDLTNIEIVEVENINSPINYIMRSKYVNLFRNCVEKCDLCFLRIPSVISNMVADICIRQNKPYLVEVGGCAWDSYWHHGITGKLCAPSMYFKEKRTVRNASYASYVTEQWLQRRYPTSCEQIAASNVYISDFNDEIVEHKIQRLALSNYKPITIGTIASVDVRYKGQEYIIRAISELKKKGYIFNYQLVGTGEGKYLKELSSRLGVAEQINFLGVKLHDDIWEWLDTLDIYAQPSKQEGLPRALIEAMSRGCICIGATTAGIPELLDEKYLFANGDVNSICKILIDIYNNYDNITAVKRSYYKSHEFALEKLKSKRDKLFLSYKLFIQTKQ